MADLFLRGRRILEHGWSRIVRVPDQPAHLSVLRAGPQPHAAPRPHRVVRRLRNAWSGPHSLLPPRFESRPSVEAGCSEALFLVTQYRPYAHVGPQLAAGWAASGLGIDPARYMVCAIRRVHAIRLDADAPLDAHTRRHRILHRCRRICMVCAGVVDRAFLRQDETHWPGFRVVRHTARTRRGACRALNSTQRLTRRLR